MIDTPPITAKEFFEKLAPAPPDDTCRTCRFWEQIDGGNYGKDNNAQVVGSSIFFPLVISSSSEITTHMDFGCIFHRPKEAG